MPINIIFFILAIIFTATSLAKQPFKVVVGLSKPPYVIEENQSGFELELIHQVLTAIGKDIEFVFVPFGRSEKMFELADISAVITVNKQMFPNIASLSESYINYQNIAISLKKDAISVNSISDLSKYSIASFQLAHKVLGEEFALAVSSSSMFMQVANQEKQVELLLLGRVDILIMDVKIFLHYLNKLGRSAQRSDVQFHYIFPLSPYRVAFKNNQDMNAFNQAMRKFKTTNDYQILAEKYNF
tara:strand:+ start:810 stop:1538 length:729 start_codon:yes stop_codon:yes gene_type:complete